MPNLELSFQGRDEAFSVRNFRVQAGLSTPFAISLWARSELDDADLDGIAGSDARFTVIAPASLAGGAPTLTWTGVCAHIELVHAEPSGLSTYSLTLVPRLWLLGQRTNCRIFQRMTAPEMAAQILREWEIEPELRLDAGAHPTLDLRMQYNETDLSFVMRMLEEAGVAYFFRTVDGRSRLVLSDRPGRADMAGAPIPFAADASTLHGQSYATHVYRATRVRSGAYRVRDYDFRNPPFDLHGDAEPRPPEQRFERYEHAPGASLAVTGASGPVIADDRGMVNADPRVLAAVAQRRLDAERVDRKVLSFETNVLTLEPGAITAITGHPRSDLGADTRLLVTSTTLEGSDTGDWHLVAKAVFAARPFRPPLATPKPRILGMQSAAVVGPAAEEIHTDEFGRVRVLFPWDREGARADRSSCWIRVSQGWAGAGFGMVAIPRVGDEVLVAFLDGDPDQPVVVGRLYNATHLHPYPLPGEKAVSGVKTQSTPGGRGFNELRFDDRAGAELVHLRAQRNLDETVIADHTTNVGHGQHLTVGASRSANVGASDSLRIGGSQSVHVAHSSSQEIGGAATSRVGGARSARVGGDDQLEVGANLTIRTGEVFHVIAGTTEPSDAVIQASGHGRLFAKDTLYLQSATSVELSCGSTRLVLTPEGLTIRAQHVRIEGTEDVLVVHDTSHVRVAASIEVASGTVQLQGSGSAVTLNANASLRGGQVSLGSGQSSSRNASEQSGSPNQATIRVVPPEGHQGPLTVRIAMPNGEIVERQTDGNNQVTVEGQPGERFTVIDVQASNGALRWNRSAT